MQSQRCNKTKREKWEENLLGDFGRHDVGLSRCASESGLGGIDGEVLSSSSLLIELVDRDGAFGVDRSGGVLARARCVRC